MVRILSIIFLALCFVYLATACSPQRTHVEMPAHLDTSALSAEQRAIVLEAADAWYIATGGTVDLASEGAGEAVPVTDADLRFEKAWGETYANAGTVRLDFSAMQAWGADHDAMLFTVEHEIGHLLGLPDGAGLMSGHEVQRPEIDAQSLARVCETYGGCK